MLAGTYVVAWNGSHSTTVRSTPGKTATGTRAPERKLATSTYSIVSPSISSVQNATIDSIIESSPAIPYAHSSDTANIPAAPAPAGSDRLPARATAGRAITM